MNELWDKAWAKETEGLDLTTARRAGRATKENQTRKMLFGGIHRVPSG
jgi:hypothetical protein